MFMAKNCQRKGRYRHDSGPFLCPLVIDQFSLDNFLGLILAGIHKAYPFHLVSGIQLSGGTGVLG